MHAHENEFDMGGWRGCGCGVLFDVRKCNWQFQHQVASGLWPVAWPAIVVCLLSIASHIPKGSLSVCVGVTVCVCQQSTKRGTEQSKNETAATAAQNRFIKKLNSAKKIILFISLSIFLLVFFRRHRLALKLTPFFINFPVGSDCQMFYLASISSATFFALLFATFPSVVGNWKPEKLIWKVLYSYNHYNMIFTCILLLCLF